MIRKLKFFQNFDKKSLDLFKHIGFSSIYKVGSILISLILVPLSINYLGNENYGLWLTIFSFLGWFNIVDFGIGNGLRNKLTEAITNKNIELAKGYISTAYLSMTFISILTLLFFVIIFPLMNWHIVFNFEISNKSIRQLIFIAFMMFSINLTLKNINILFYADQRSSYPELFSFIGQLLTLIAVYIAMTLSDESLLSYGIIILGSQMVVLFIATILSFIGNYKKLRPNISYFNINLVKDILSIGGKFFIIQISAILIYTTDNFIINNVLGASEVTVYNIPYKYFMLIMTIMAVISTPYWSAFTKAYTQNENLWQIQSIKTLKKISLLIISLAIVMIIVSNKVYNLWVGDLVHVPLLLTLLMGLNVMIRVYMYPYIMCLNGIGKVKIELYLGGILAIINIPLSIFLAKYTELGVSGVILSTLLVGLVEFVIYPIQVKKILNNTAKGIWNA